MTDLRKGLHLKRQDGFLMRIPLRALIGLFSSVLGLTLGVIALVMRAEIDHISTLEDARVVNSSNLREDREAIELPQHTLPLTGDEKYLQDLQRIFEVASANNLRLGQIDHQWASGPEPGIRLHTLNLQMSDSYPNMRSFLYGMVDALPHLAIHSLRIERRDPQSVEVEITLQLLLLYRVSKSSINGD